VKSARQSQEFAPASSVSLSLSSTLRQPAEPSSMISPTIDGNPSAEVWMHRSLAGQPLRAGARGGRRLASVQASELY
jgi:hypothetical protein